MTSEKNRKGNAPQAETKTAGAKKIYTAPKLTDHGAISKLTAGSGAGCSAPSNHKHY